MKGFPPGQSAASFPPRQDGTCRPVGGGRRAGLETQGGGLTGDRGPLGGLCLAPLCRPGQLQGRADNSLTFVTLGHSTSRRAGWQRPPPRDLLDWTLAPGFLSVGLPRAQDELGPQSGFRNAPSLWHPPATPVAFCPVWSRLPVHGLLRSHHNAPLGGAVSVRPHGGQWSPGERRGVAAACHWLSELRVHGCAPPTHNTRVLGVHLLTWRHTALSSHACTLTHAHTHTPSRTGAARVWPLQLPPALGSELCVARNQLGETSLPLAHPRHGRGPSAAPTHLPGALGDSLPGLSLLPAHAHAGKPHALTRVTQGSPAGHGEKGTE